MRKWVMGGVVAVLVVGVGIAAFGSGSGGSGPKPLLITAKVERQDLKDQVTVAGTLGRVDQRTINAAAASTVSKVHVSDGATMQAGQPIIALDGRDAISETGDVSFFRKLDVGATGGDVLQLEQILQASGYSPGTVDTLYTEQTRSALGQWQGAHNYPGANPQSEQTVTVSLQPGTGYKVGERSSAAAVIGPRVSTATKTTFHPPPRARIDAVLASTHRLLPCPPAPPLPQISISGTTTVSEGSAATITVSANPSTLPDPACPVQVLLTASGDATPGLDYDTFSPTVTLTNAAPSATLVLQTRTDIVAESDEHALVSIAPSPTYYTIAPASIATVTIHDTSAVASPVVSLTPSTSRVAKGQPAQFTVGLSQPLGTPLQISLVFGGDAVSGADYSQPAGAIIIPSGQTSLPITVPTLDNGVVQNDHTLSVALGSSASYTIGSPNGGSVVIVSQDVPKINIVGGSKLGKGGTAHFRITADQAPARDTTIQYSATGTAKPGVDISPLTGTVLLRAGTTSADISLFTLNNDVVFFPTDMIVAHWPTRVGATLVKEGAIVAPGMPLFSITETGFTVTLNASASDRTKLKVGQQVTVKLQGGDTSAPGVISSLDENATIDATTKQQTYKGKVQVQGDLGAADGAGVTIDVVLENRAGVLTVPIAAVKQNGIGQDVVRVIDLKHGGAIQERRVKTGLSQASFIEIKSGLRGNEIVVVQIDQGTG